MIPFALVQLRDRAADRGPFADDPTDEPQPDGHRTRRAVRDLALLQVQAEELGAADVGCGA